MSAYFALGALTMQIILLAIALSFIGFAASKIIHHVLDSRRAERMRKAATSARLRARANRARAQVIAS